MRPLLVLCVLLAVALPSSFAVSRYCCPTCTGNNDECYAVNEAYGLFEKGGDCVAACPGSCQKSASGYTCGLEPCGPDPCSSASAADAALRGRALKKPVGFCAAGTNTSAYPLRDQPGYWGSYGYHVSMAHTMLDLEQRTVADGFKLSALDSHVHVPQASNSVFYPTKGGDSRWRLTRLADEATELDWVDLGKGSYPRSYAASDDVVVVGALTGGTLHWTSYASDENATLSDVTVVPAYDGSIPFPAVALGSTVNVLTYNDNVYSLYVWDATSSSANDDARRVNVTVSDCSFHGSTDAASKIKSMQMRSDGAKMYFTAQKPLGSTVTQLCVLDVATGTTTPLLADNAKYTRARGYLEVSFFDDAVIYTAASGYTISTGDMVVCRGLWTSGSSGPTCTWVAMDMQSNVKYTFTPMYSNYHYPVHLDSRQRAVMYGDVLVYPAYPESDIYSVFSYNLTSRQVLPVALVYDVPNTKCNLFTGDNSVDIEEFSFQNTFVMKNGTLVFGVSYMSNQLGGEQITKLVTVSSASVLPALACPNGCAPNGGHCIAGVCHCQPGCSGVDCSVTAGNASYCSPAVATDDDW